MNEAESETAVGRKLNPMSSAPFPPSYPRRSTADVDISMNKASQDFGELQAAARSGQLIRVQSLLDRGVDQNRHPGMPHSLSPLMTAANHGHLEVVQLLVERGANIHFMDGDGFTALTIAAGRGDWEIVKLLAQRGGDVSHKDASGVSGLSAAERTGDAALLAFLQDFSSGSRNS